MQNKPSQTVLLTAFFAVVFFFGSSWLGNKIVLDQGIPPFYGAAGRFSIAAVFLLFLRFIIPTKHKLTREHVIVILMYGLIMIGLVNAMTFWGMQFITSSLSSIIFSVYPIIIMVLSHILLQDDKLDLKRLAGVLTGFIGVTVLFYDKSLFTVHKQELFGMLIFLLSVIINAFPNVILKKSIERTDVLTLTSGGMLIGSIFLWIAAVLFEGAPTFILSRPAVLSEIYLGIFSSSAGFFLYFWLLKHMKVSTLSLTAYLTPIVGIILGVFFYAEKLYIQHFIGMILIFAGIRLIRKPLRQQQDGKI